MLWILTKSTRKIQKRIKKEEKSDSRERKRKEKKGSYLIRRISFLKAATLHRTVRLFLQFLFQEKDHIKPPCGNFGVFAKQKFNGNHQHQKRANSITYVKNCPYLCYWSR